MNISSNSPSMSSILQVPFQPPSQSLSSPANVPATPSPSTPEQSVPLAVRPSFEFDTPAVAFPNASPPVSKEEKAWAMALEDKVKTQKYQPTNDEVEKYEDIFQRLQTDGIQKKTAKPSSTPVSKNEIDWALKMESKVKEGYDPSLEEIAKYKKIAKRLQTEGQQTKMPEPSSPPVSKKEIDWALQMESKVKEGYNPSPEEMAKYKKIAKRLQTEGQQTKMPEPVITVPKEELDWAMELESKVKEGYGPSSEEMAKYEDIAERLKISIESP